jgi:hypothetical protein
LDSRRHAAVLSISATLMLGEFSGSRRSTLRVRAMRLRPPAAIVENESRPMRRRRARTESSRAQGRPLPRPTRLRHALLQAASQQGYGATVELWPMVARHDGCEEAARQSLRAVARGRAACVLPERDGAAARRCGDSAAAGCRGHAAAGGLFMPPLQPPRLPARRPATRRTGPRPSRAPSRGRPTPSPRPSRRRVRGTARCGSAPPSGPGGAKRLRQPAAAGARRAPSPLRQAKSRLGKYG